MASTKPYIKQRRWRIIADKIHDEWCIENGYPIKIQAPSFKPQATSVKHQAIQAASNKHQAPSNKHQAPSREQQAPRFYSPHKDTRG
jgi:hypothetical protein